MLPRLELATRIELVMHHRETDKPTATGELALKCLAHGRLHVHGEADAALDLSELHDPHRRLWLLFPSDEAVVMSRELVAADPRPVTLVVPDGSWRQASKMARRIPGLETAQHVVLPLGAPSSYRLRHEPRRDGLATFEAIARALGILEGADVQLRLEAVFHQMVTQTLQTRQRPPGTRPPTS